jgi:UDP-N-acetyl-D-mannosaminuronic acid transferase (WecB/TagA/CpsF family)
MNDNIKAGSDIHAGDGGYSIGTKEKYDEFVKIRNQSLVKARIKEFEKQSGLEIFGLGARKEIWESATEKFTQLIVQECVQICEQGTTTQTTSTGAASMIKQHFGVKE